MATVKITLDSRTKKDGTAALLLLFSDKQCRRKLNLGISIEAAQWNEKKCEVTSKVAGARQINKRIQLIRASAEAAILRNEGTNFSGDELFAEVEAEIYPDRAEKRKEVKQAANSLTEVAKRFTELKKPSTRLTYERIVKHIETFVGQDNINQNRYIVFGNCSMLCNCRLSETVLFSKYERKLRGFNNLLQPHSISHIVYYYKNSKQNGFDKSKVPTLDCR